MSYLGLHYYSVLNLNTYQVFGDLKLYDNAVRVSSNDAYFLYGEDDIIYLLEKTGENKSDIVALRNYKTYVREIHRESVGFNPGNDVSIPYEESDIKCLIIHLFTNYDSARSFVYEINTGKLLYKDEKAEKFKTTYLSFDRDKDNKLVIERRNG